MTGTIECLRTKFFSIFPNGLSDFFSGLWIFLGKFPKFPYQKLAGISFFWEIWKGSFPDPMAFPGNLGGVSRKIEKNLGA